MDRTSAVIGRILFGWGMVTATWSILDITTHPVGIFIGGVMIGFGAMTGWRD